MSTSKVIENPPSELKKQNKKVLLHVGSTLRKKAGPKYMC